MWFEQEINNTWMYLLEDTLKFLDDQATETAKEPHMKVSDSDISGTTSTGNVKSNRCL